MKFGLFIRNRRAATMATTVILGGLTLYIIVTADGCQRHENKSAKLPIVLASCGALFHEQTLPDSVLIRAGIPDSCVQELHQCRISGMRVEKRADLRVWLVVDFDLLLYRAPLGLRKNSRGPYRIDGPYAWECLASHAIAQPAYYGPNDTGYVLWLDNWPPGSDDIDRIPHDNSVGKWFYDRDR